MDTNSKKQIIVVLGMHRSGTSAMTRGLQALGVELGNRLMPKSQGNNAKGFWEDLDINSLNIELLRSLGHDWHSLTPVLPEELAVPATKAFKLRAVEILRSRLWSADSFGMKDPRIPRLIPFWQSVFKHLNVRVGYVIACRNPMSVARSLAKRDGFELEKGYYLWLEHTIYSLCQTAGQNRIVVDYDRLLENPAVELQRIGQLLGLTFDPQGTAFEAYQRFFLDSTLRHNRFLTKDLELEKSIPPSAAELYKTLLEVAAGRLLLEDSGVASLVSRLSAGLRENYPALRYMQTCDEKINEALHQVSVRDARISALEQEVSAREVQVAHLEVSVSERDSRIADLKQEVSAREVQVAHLEVSISERDSRIADLMSIVAEREDQIGVLKQKLQTANDEISRIFRSKSWLLTAPLRFARLKLVSRPYWFFRKIVSDASHWCWHHLPVPIRFKQDFKSALFGGLPYFFSWTQAYQSWKNFNAAPEEAPVHQVKTEGAGEKLPDGRLQEPLDEYVPLLVAAPLEHKPAKLICFYLPQFHPIPENDAWWGEGFTEWTNVKPAEPQFVGHYQPRIPGELGYYNLLDTQVQLRQVALARLYGIEGFCFYFYWFGGKRLLEAPVENYLNDSRLDLPFCLCWANENWSRRWDGLDNEVLLAQRHSPEDDMAFIQRIARYMRDPRYIRIDNKPLLLVYRPSLMPAARETAARWRNWCGENGVGEIYLAYIQSFEVVDPKKYGFDAAIEFPPNNSAPPNITASVSPLTANFACTVYDWKVFVERSENYKQPKYKLFRGVCPSWDNTPRRKSCATIFVNNSPELYQKWLGNAIKDTQKRHCNPDERLIFVNAWNEWAEAAYLEPDQRYGYAYLDATRMALIKNDAIRHNQKINYQKIAIVIHAFYVDVFKETLRRLEKLDFPSKLFVTTPFGQAGIIEPLLEESGFDYNLTEVTNLGRDILPFLKIILHVLAEGYEVFLKLHTKKSKHRKDGHVWMNDILSKLVGPEIIRQIVQKFNENKNIGIIGPVSHIVPMSTYWGSNEKTVLKLAARLGLDREKTMSVPFVAGSMFYGRISAIKPLLNLAITEREFSKEAGQVDGTMAHAIERLFSISAIAVNQSIVSTEWCGDRIKLTSTLNNTYRFVS